MVSAAPSRWSGGGGEPVADVVGAVEGVGTPSVIDMPFGYGDAGAAADAPYAVGFDSPPFGDLVFVPELGGVCSGCVRGLSVGHAPILSHVGQSVKAYFPNA